MYFKNNLDFSDEIGGWFSMIVVDRNIWSNIQLQMGANINTTPVVNAPLFSLACSLQLIHLKGSVCRVASLQKLNVSDMMYAI